MSPDHSVTQTANTMGCMRGRKLKYAKWNVASLAVDEIQSSFFEHQGTFSPGSVKFDCALLMRGILH